MKPSYFLQNRKMKFLWYKNYILKYSISVLLGNINTKQCEKCLIG